MEVKGCPLSCNIGNTVYKKIKVFKMAVLKAYQKSSKVGEEEGDVCFTLIVFCCHVTVSFRKVRHNSRIESWLGCILGTLRVVLCTKMLHFVSRNWCMEN